VRVALRIRHRSRKTERAYVGWIRRFILLNAKRHTAEMGAAEVERFSRASSSRLRLIWQLTLDNALITAGQAEEALRISGEVRDVWLIPYHVSRA
jgi:Phage integrase, N-terminal SAM-like domain